MGGARTKQTKQQKKIGRERKRERESEEEREKKEEEEIIIISFRWSKYT